ncbi:CRE-SRJ-42 protein [Caenorhabditis remanei]|uniref:CRE-SRJ-42 protein n=1 Tax=Caenorhabditis remanei TaxID=31234 RepID=E3LLJ8_CAERE|nr:CRE-SRJ-42 protein [Caenorhabditis remanei]
MVRIFNKRIIFQVELLRALIVQTVIPIFISFSPCLLCWYSPMFGIQLARGFNYVEVSALGVFAFVDPVAIILCLPIFRLRIFRICRGGSMFSSAKSSSAQSN